MICTSNVQMAAGSVFFDCSYNRDMDFDEKQRLAHKDDTGLAACAIRLRAARKVTGREAQDLAKDSGVSKQVYSNAENGLNYPNRDVMRHLYRAYRIDFNFMFNGDFVQLPGDVQERLFPALVEANDEWDRKASSDRAREKSQPSPQRS